MFPTRTRPFFATGVTKRRAIVGGLLVAITAGASLVGASAAGAAAPTPAAVTAAVTSAAATPAPAPTPTTPPPPALPKPGRPPLHPAAAAGAIRAAYHQALTGGGTPARALAAVDDGPSLAGALAQAMANFPTATANAKVSTGALVFTNPRTAALRFHVTYPDGLDFGTQVGGAVQVGGRWKVSRDTYCLVLGWAGATCPPRAGRPPADPAAARTAIAAAFHQALTGGGTPAEALAAVEDGPSLAGALAQATANYPTAVASARVTTGTVTFTDPRHASVPFSVTDQDGADFGTANGIALIVDGQWKVSRDTYCVVLGWAGASCPARS